MPGGISTALRRCPTASGSAMATVQLAHALPLNEQQGTSGWRSLTRPDPLRCTRTLHPQVVALVRWSNLTSPGMDEHVSFAAAVRDGETYTCYHRTIDRNQRILSVVSVGTTVVDREDREDREDRTTEIEGYYIDLTAASPRRHRHLRDGLQQDDIAVPAVTRPQGRAARRRGEQRR